MADGDNWDALGKVAAASWISVLTGDYESAWNLSTDWDLYEGKNWDKKEDPEAKFKAAYEDYKKKYEEQIRLDKQYLDNLRSRKENTCSWSRTEPGKKGYKLHDTVDVNYTIWASAMIGSSDMDKFYKHTLTSTTKEECEKADCLHECYGASHESNCNLCFQIAIVDEFRAKFTNE